MKPKKYKYLVADFETTVFEGQEETEVWAAAVVELFTEDCKIFHSISETFEYLKSLKTNICCYFHNLKFDGSFWLDYFIRVLKLKQAITNPEDLENAEWLTEKDMPNYSFKYSISDMGQWYSITIKINNKIIEIRDSLKLLPFSVSRIGKSFKTKHQKLEMEYKGYRYAGCEITPQEQEYIKNDVFVVKEALEIMFDLGHNKLTIGSCCLSEYKKLLENQYGYMYDNSNNIHKFNDSAAWNHFFPDLTELELQPVHKYKTIDEYIRKSYKGGWTYLVEGKENQIFENGTTADVNSLYPSMMSSESGNKYPVGMPKWWTGNKIPRQALQPDKYFFVRLKTRFKLKEGYLPFIQIKGNYLYRGNECLKTSDIFDRLTQKYYRYYYDDFNEKQDTFVELVLTETDYKLFQEHYELIDPEIIDGCFFDAEIGLFDEYIEKYKKIKQESKSAVREWAKLMLNNLYGKMASSTESSFKVAYLKDDETIGFYTILQNKKKAGYIPVGSAITSYARNFTIRAAQKNYYGADKAGFIYADTDSIHCNLSADEIKGIKTHDTAFCCWKLESSWDKAIFVRQKTYTEHNTHENLQTIEPFYNVKCAGMPEKCKNLFILSITQNYTQEEFEKMTEQEKEFVSYKRELKDFAVNMLVPSKLIPRRIKGGIILEDSTYYMHDVQHKNKVHFERKLK